MSDDYDRYIGIIDEAEKIEVVIKDSKIKWCCKAKLIYHKSFYINYLIQYLLLYKVIYFRCSVFWGAVWEGRLLCFVCFASALFYVYACM